MTKAQVIKAWEQWQQFKCTEKLFKVVSGYVAGPRPQDGSDIVQEAAQDALVRIWDEFSTEQFGTVTVKDEVTGEKVKVTITIHSSGDMFYKWLFGTQHDEKRNTYRRKWRRDEKHTELFTSVEENEDGEESEPQEKVSDFAGKNRGIARDKDHDYTVETRFLPKRGMITGINVFLDGAARVRNAGDVMLHDVMECEDDRTALFVYFYYHRRMTQAETAHAMGLTKGALELWLKRLRDRVERNEADGVYSESRWKSDPALAYQIEQDREHRAKHRAQYPQQQQQPQPDPHLTTGTEEGDDRIYPLRCSEYNCDDDENVYVWQYYQCNGTPATLPHMTLMAADVFDALVYSNGCYHTWMASDLAYAGVDHHTDEHCEDWAAQEDGSITVVAVNVDVEEVKPQPLPLPLPRREKLQQPAPKPWKVPTPEQREWLLTGVKPTAKPTPKPGPLDLGQKLKAA